MQFSEQIIQIMDKLCEKFGIVMDWSNSNVLPYVQELSSRLVKYEIWTSLLWITFMILIITMSGIFCKNRYNVYKNDKNRWSDNEEAFIFSFIVFITCLISCSLAIFVQSLDIIQALTIPERTIIEFLSNYIR
ncbi:TPA: hypothetical protein LA460_000162 [Clostridium botulinum]|nr:hypothetical protein [Clostridium botulinum]HBJ1652767.1 hypothetical protein [Clostridium botulinum]